ncbi:Neuropeptide FF receptor 1 [Bulinus truncatus]|nr:Neuropeptide FF receptor 1 [Bulinus truncatus]
MRIMKRNAVIIICVIWGMSFFLMIPWAVYYENYNMVNNTLIIPACSEVWTNYDWQRSFYVVVLFLGTYVIPLAIISFCYTLVAWRVCHRHAPGVAGGNEVIRRCKVNVVKMLATVVLMFAISWLPLQVLYMLMYFYHPEKFLEMIYVAVPIAQWMGLSNSGMNAFIYGFYSQNFRRGFKRMFNWIHLRSKPSGGETK